MHQVVERIMLRYGMAFKENLALGIKQEQYVVDLKGVHHLLHPEQLPKFDLSLMALFLDMDSD